MREELTQQDQGNTVKKCAQVIINHSNDNKYPNGDGENKDSGAESPNTNENVNGHESNESHTLENNENNTNGVITKVENKNTVNMDYKLDKPFLAFYLVP